MSFLILVLFLLPLGFEVHAFFVIFDESGSTPLNWVGFGATVTLVLAALAVLLAWAGQMDEEVRD